MAVVTISRELGSLGNEVAAAVAARLSYRIVQREVINQAAIRAGAPEVALATIDELGLLELKPSRKATQAYIQAMSQVLHELAEAGNIVIVGRAGQVILHDQAYVLHVRITAPASLRAQRIAQLQQIALEAAIAQIEASDRMRRNYVKRLFHSRWDDPGLYDLIINTGRVAVSTAADLICGVVSRAAITPVLGSP